MRIVFFMDPLSGIRPAGDTSFALMLAAQRRGHEIWHCQRSGLSLEQGSVQMKATRLEVVDEAAHPCRVLELRQLRGDEIDALCLRSDPPFDQDYLADTWLLEFLPPACIFLNSPSGVRNVSEKLWCPRFPHLVPPTRITADIQDLASFRQEHGDIVIKPVDGHAGRGVFLILRDDCNAAVAFETLSGGGKRPVILQAALEGAKTGDKRILLLAGEPLGALLRVHGDSDHRNNFRAGGKPVPCGLDEHDLRICAELKPWLLKHDLDFVGIDIIGGKLIEVNVTSPTCVREISRFAGEFLEDRVIQRLEEKGRASLVNLNSAAVEWSRVERLEG
ncbi:MAG: hypothetical protein RL095_924 [Verrucomicrobiota bacterium]